jgi:hypothetical protein
MVALPNLALEHALWKNPRTITGLGDKELREFGEDIHERGQIMPCLVQKIVAPDTEDGYVNLVLDGQRRCMGLEAYARTAKVSKHKIELKCVDLYPDAIELTQESSDRMLRDILAAAVKRAGLGSFEQTEAAMQLKSRNAEMTMAEIGKAIGRSESWVSRMVRARKLACDALVNAWARQKVTDEQFKDLADINPHDKQKEALDDLLGLREKGGRDSKAEARNKLKEKAAKAKAEKKAGKPAKKSKAKKAATAKANPDVLTKTKPLLSEIVGLKQYKKPSDPYVKGVMDMARYSMGEMSVDDFAPAYRTYLKQCSKAAERTEA